MRSGIPSLLLLLLCGACCMPFGDHEASPEERAAAAEQAAHEAARLERGRANAAPRAGRIPGLAALIDPNAPVQRRSCPATLPVRSGPLGEIVPTASYASLESVDGEEESWRWLNGWGGMALAVAHGVTDEWARLRNDGAAAMDPNVLAALGGEESAVLVVFVHRARTPTSSLGGDRFQLGSWEGGFYVIDVDAGQVLCSAPFRARGDVPIVIGDDPQADYDDVLRSNFELAATDALDSISGSRLIVDVHRLF